MFEKMKKEKASGEDAIPIKAIKMEVIFEKNSKHI